MAQQLLPTTAPSIISTTSEDMRPGNRQDASVGSYGRSIVASPISALAVELLSEILAMASGYEEGYSEASEGNRNHRWSPLVILGEVCKNWRDVILGTPKLWTTLIVNPSMDFKFTNLIQKRIFRSGGLPISLVVRHRRGSGGVTLEDIQPLLDLIRTCSARWNRVFLYKVDCDVLYEIFKNLKDTTRIEDLRIVYGSLWKEVPMFQPLRPHKFEAQTISGALVHFHDLNFLQWDNLRHLIVDDIDAELVLHIVNHAVNLETIVIKSIRLNTFRYHIHGNVITLPNERKSIHNSSVTHLEMSLLGVKDALQYLCFPSLKTLVCRLDPKGAWEDSFYSEETEIVEFFERSHAIMPIQNVMLELQACNGMTLLGHEGLGPWSVRGSSIWHSRYPPLTHLRINVDSFKVSPKTFDDTLRELRYGAEDDSVLFPSLQILEIQLIYFMKPDRWNSFIDMFPPSIAYHGTEKSPHSYLVKPMRRSLSKVALKLVNKDEVLRPLVHDGDLMKQDQFLQLLNIQRSGVELQLIGRDGEDFLVHAGRKYRSDSKDNEE
ncbi:hypothetical protein JR316_0001662 [Psilocybe cubensis]|uniref:F-box domain-containing protein n=2 Tax=Psilocybe cubensis TaxID=181762 RepID=A0A8H8CNQ4_PSICU|nr:hypothetical protein JR316_0001662 [Psilocybe cubensis]KAH9484761.1 hypothetical protein JR316_0001662 [Psilocybe cubensis]